MTAFLVKPTGLLSLFSSSGRASRENAFRRCRPRAQIPQTTLFGNALIVEAGADQPTHFFTRFPEGSRFLTGEIALVGMLVRTLAAFFHSFRTHNMAYPRSGNASHSGKEVIRSITFPYAL